MAANRGLSQPCHALHRLSTPEHPPRTLYSLTTLFSYSPAHDAFASPPATVALEFFKTRSFWCSYSCHQIDCQRTSSIGVKSLVEATGFEPATPSLQLVLYQLSYAPLLLIEPERDECPARPPSNSDTTSIATDLEPEIPTRCCSDHGGPEWIRTTYLALIRRVL